MLDALYDGQSFTLNSRVVAVILQQLLTSKCQGVFTSLTVDLAQIKPILVQDASSLLYELSHPVLWC